MVQLLSDLLLFLGIDCMIKFRLIGNCVSVGFYHIEYLPVAPWSPRLTWSVCGTKESAASTSAMIRAYKIQECLVERILARRCQVALSLSTNKTSDTTDLQTLFLGLPELPNCCFYPDYY